MCTLCCYVELHCVLQHMAFMYRVIHKSLRDFRPLWYSSRDCHAEGEHVNRGRGNPSFCPTLQVLDMSTLLCLSWLLRSRVRKFRRDLRNFFFFPLWRCGPTRAMASSFLRFLDHTQRRITVGRTSLDEWSARRRDLTTHNTHNRQTSMPPMGFQPTISAGKRPQTGTGTYELPCILNDYHKKCRLFPCATLTGWSFSRKGTCSLWGRNGNLNTILTSGFGSVFLIKRNKYSPSKAIFYYCWYYK